MMYLFGVLILNCCKCFCACYIIVCMPPDWASKLVIISDKSTLSGLALQVLDSAGRLPLLALSLLPLIAEAIAVGLCLGLWLKLKVFLAIAAALILSATCPAVTNATMHAWQQSRLGTRKGTRPCASEDEHGSHRRFDT